MVFRQPTRLMAPSETTREPSPACGGPDMVRALVKWRLLPSAFIQKMFQIPLRDELRSPSVGGLHGNHHRKTALLRSCPHQRGNMTAGGAGAATGTARDRIAPVWLSRVGPDRVRSFRRGLQKPELSRDAKQQALRRTSALRQERPPPREDFGEQTSDRRTAASRSCVNAPDRTSPERQ